MEFKRMGRPLKYDVFCGKTCVIPAGTKGVEIAYRQSHLMRYDDAACGFVPLNVYRHNGKIYHN